MLRHVASGLWIAGVVFSACSVDDSYTYGQGGAGAGGASGASGSATTGARPGGSGGTGGTLSGKGGGAGTPASGGAEAGATSGGATSSGATGQGGSAGADFGGESGEGQGGAVGTGGDAAGGAETTGGTATTGGVATTGGSASGGKGGTSSGGAGTGGSTGGAASTCTAAQTCAPAVPAGWIGPTITATGTTLPACPSSYPTSGFDAGTVNQGTGSCACNCTQPLNATCALDMQVLRHSAASCAGTASSTSLAGVDDCVGAEFASSSGLTLSPPIFSCASGTTSGTFNPPSLTGMVRGCAGTTTAASCNGTGVCVTKPPAAFANRLCVYRSGDNACPSGYATKTLLYGGFDDTRRCPSTCTCTKSTGECYASVTPYRGGNVGNWCGSVQTDIEITSLDESCLMAIGADPTGMRLATTPTLRSGSAKCTGQSPSPTGSVAGNNPISVCCTN